MEITKYFQNKKQNVRARRGTVSSFKDAMATTKGTFFEENGKIDEGSSSDADCDELQNNLNKIREYILNVNKSNELKIEEDKCFKVREIKVLIEQKNTEGRNTEGRNTEGRNTEGRNTELVFKVPRLLPEEFAKNCFGCEMNFGVCRWKYHCRVCGFVFCFYCSWNFDSFLPFYVSVVRICNRCISHQKNNNQLSM
jgi:hypothetical protein